MAVAERLKDDTDLTQQLGVVTDRLCRFEAGQRLGCSSGETLGASWRAAAERANDEEYDALLRALLAVAKVKPLWSEVVPEPLRGATGPDEIFFRDQLALNVARSIARLEPQAHPLASFFHWLAPRR